jgi:hypothetical protein
MPPDLVTILGAALDAHVYAENQAFEAICTTLVEAEVAGYPNADALAAEAREAYDAAFAPTYDHLLAERKFEAELKAKGAYVMPQAEVN